MYYIKQEKFRSINSIVNSDDILTAEVKQLHVQFKIF